MFPVTIHSYCSLRTRFWWLLFKCHNHFFCKINHKTWIYSTKVLIYNNRCKNANGKWVQLICGTSVHFSWKFTRFVVDNLLSQSNGWEFGRLFMTISPYFKYFYVARGGGYKCLEGKKCCLKEENVTNPSLYMNINLLVFFFCWKNKTNKKAFQ